LSVSPVFGGATAQAEFEVLCGVPAFEKVSSVEFNAFTGAPAHCLPDLLSELGYRSVASNAYKPNFFNAQPAYQGMGFSEQQFPAEFYSAGPTYIHAGDPGAEDYMFDGDLFAQNLAFIRDHLRRNPEQPLFNYVLTIYGHTPHNLDPDKRPQLIQVQAEFQDEHLQRSVNQFYYRTQEIARYARELIALDPDSLIVLIADHVPPLQFGPNTYNALRYLGNRERSYFYNRIAVIENGRPVKFEPLRHYNLPELIADRLTDGRLCATSGCAYQSRDNPPREAYLDRYLVLMAHASE
jgi:phosphoglycerol transferase MdoB-like AlkP superfamily enzyme